MKRMGALRYGFSYVDVTIQDGVAAIRIGDPNDERFLPDRHPMHREVRDVFPALSDDPDVAAVVILGGEKAFIPFPELANLDALLDAHPDSAEMLQREARQIVDNIIDFEKPLVAAVSREARGMGSQIALLADFIVTREEIVFQDTHVRLGLASGDGATVVWPLVLGLGRARRHLLRGHPISGADLHAAGAAELVGPGVDVDAAAAAIAEKLANTPRSAFRATKLALNQWLRLGATASLAHASVSQVATYESPEFMALRLAARAPEPRSR